MISIIPNRYVVRDGGVLKIVSQLEKNLIFEIKWKQLKTTEIKFKSTERAKSTAYQLKSKLRMLKLRDQRRMSGTLISDLYELHKRLKWASYAT